MGAGLSAINTSMGTHLAILPTLGSKSAANEMSMLDRLNVQMKGVVSEVGRQRVRRGRYGDRRLVQIAMSPKQIRSIAEADGRVNAWSGSVRSGKTVSSILRWFMFLASPRTVRPLRHGRPYP